jgi:hypothetical protein
MRRKKNMPRKKEGIWKQVSLNSKAAVDWCRNGSEVRASKIEFGRAKDFGDKFELPEWAVEANKDTMIIHDVNRMKWPLMVTSQPVIRFIVDVIVKAEENGARAKQDGGIMSIEFEDEVAPAWKFVRDEKAGRFAPYQVVELEEVDE